MEFSEKRKTYLRNGLHKIWLQKIFFISEQWKYAQPIVGSAIFALVVLASRKPSRAKQLTMVPVPAPVLKLLPSRNSCLDYFNDEQ